jgi:dephospho-CoA kinase
MLKVGLTGNIGSGKTIVSNIFKVFGVAVYNSDESAGMIMERPEVTSEILNTFGNAVLDINGKPAKKKIAGLVFADRSALEKLNNIIHPHVIADFEKWLEENKKEEYVIMESAILFETGYFSLFDKIIFVSAPEALRLKRVMGRDHVDAVSVKARMRQQMPERNKIQKADFVIRNNEKKPLLPQVQKIHQALLECAG